MYILVLILLTACAILSAIGSVATFRAAKQFTEALLFSVPLAVSAAVCIYVISQLLINGGM